VLLVKVVLDVSVVEVCDGEGVFLGVGEDQDGGVTSVKVRAERVGVAPASEVAAEYLCGPWFSASVQDVESGVDGVGIDEAAGGGGLGSGGVTEFGQPALADGSGLVCHAGASVQATNDNR
jgi:hypothetical protein